MQFLQFWTEWLITTTNSTSKTRVSFVWATRLVPLTTQKIWPPNTERVGALLLVDPETVLVFKIFKYLQMYRDLSEEKNLVFT